MSTAFGGSDAAPIADRTSDSTTMMRTNDVVITNRNGTTERSVSAARTSSGTFERLACERATNGSMLRTVRFGGRRLPATQ